MSKVLIKADEISDLELIIKDGGSGSRCHLIFHSIDNAMLNVEMMTEDRYSKSALVELSRAKESVKKYYTNKYFP